jgi:hypothetical protein
VDAETVLFNVDCSFGKSMGQTAKSSSPWK